MTENKNLYEALSHAVKHAFETIDFDEWKKNSSFFLSNKIPVEEYTKECNCDPDCNCCESRNGD